MNNNTPIQTNANDNPIKIVDVCHKKKREPDLFDIIKTVCTIAVGVFSAYTSWKLFAPYFFVGICIGIYQYTQQENESEHSHGFSSCANDFLGGLTDVKLPPILNLGIGLAVFICHVDHHKNVFVPVAGIYVGAWAAKSAAYYGTLTYRCITAYFNPQEYVPT